jgi:hypothetical protein
MAPAKTLEKCGAGWELLGEGSVQTTKPPADVTNWLVQLNSGSRQNDDVCGDELLAFGSVIDGGLSPDGEFAFDPSIRLDDKFKVAGFLIATEQEDELRRIYVGYCSRDGKGFGSVAQRYDFRGNGNRPQRDRKTQQEKCSDRDSSSKTHDGRHLQYHGFQLGKREGARRMPKE